MKAAMFIVLTAVLTFALSSITNAKSGGYDIASDMGDYTAYSDDVVTIHSKYTMTNKHDEQLECGKNVEHSCQTFGVLIDKFIYSYSNNNSAKEVRHLPLRAQASISGFIKPPRS